MFFATIARTPIGTLESTVCNDAEVLLDSDLKDMIALGFPNDDAFDATVGLFGMLEVVLGMEAER